MYDDYVSEKIGNDTILITKVAGAKNLAYQKALRDISAKKKIISVAIIPNDDNSATLCMVVTVEHKRFLFF